MSSLTLKITDAGRAAIVNAQNTGTAPVLVSQIGVTDQAFVAAADTAALPGELKRLATFAGAAVAADTIHVTIRDDTTDVYSCRGFAMYLDDGTLFASYGQADPIGEKSAQSMFLLALDAIFADIDAASITFGDTDFLLSAATTEQQGIVELATDDETTTGTDAARAVVPKGLKAALDARFGAGAPSAFVKSLLTAATALAFRTALAIKAAATYDVGAGNNLDADLLDGQHGSYYRAWGNLTGVPASFPPSAHQHAWNDITGAPAYATRWADWTEVTNKPATFPPAAHSQDWSTITGKPDTAIRWPAWSEVTNKPSVPMQLGYNPVQQGTGVGQIANAVKIGWSADGLKCTVDSTDQGMIWTQSYAGIPSDYAKLSGAAFSGVVDVVTSGIKLPSFAGTASIMRGNGDAATLTAYNTVWNLWNGLAFASFTGTVTAVLDARNGAWILTGGVTAGGTITAAGYNTSSDPRLKDTLQAQSITGNVDGIGLWTWRWNAFSQRKGDGAGVRSDEVRAVFPQCVAVDAEGFDVVDYGNLGVHLGVVANRRIRAAEARAEGLARELAELAARVAQLDRIVAAVPSPGMPPR